jgi:hypothetical protein
MVCGIVILTYSCWCTHCVLEKTKQHAHMKIPTSEEFGTGNALELLPHCTMTDFSEHNK